MPLFLGDRYRGEPPIPEPVKNAKIYTFVSDENGQNISIVVSAIARVTTLQATFASQAPNRRLEGSAALHG